MKKTVVLKELREKDKQSLFKELKESQKKLTELYFNQTLRNLKNYHEITVMRKKIAYIWTILNEKTIEEINKKMQEAKTKDK